MEKIETAIDSKEELVKKLCEIASDVRFASTLLEEGKEIITYRRLQAIRTKLSVLINSFRGITVNVDATNSEQS